MRDLLTNYLQEKNLTFKEAGNEQYLLKVCPVCFGSGTPIFTSKGIKNIEDIKIGDLVLTHMGEFKPVTNTMERQATNIVKFKYQGIFNNYIKVTDNHKFYGAEIYNNKKNDNYWIRGQKYYKYGKNKQKIGLKKLYRCYKLCEKPLREANKNFYYQLGRIEFKHSNYSSLAMWIYGLYIAEGTLQPRNICFSLHRKEVIYVNKIKKYFGKENVNISYRGKNGMVVYVYGKKNVLEIRELFGNKKCYEKYIPYKLLIDKNIKYLLNGILDGDGCYRKDGLILLRQTSETLAYQVQLIANSLGYYVSGSFEKDEVIKPGFKNIKRKVFVVTIRKDNFKNNIYGHLLTNTGMFWKGTILKNKYENNNVYNLTVEDDHSYVIGNLVVKNCGDDKGTHFYINQNSGQWDCKKCQAKGGFNKLRGILGDSEIDLSKYKTEGNRNATEKTYKTIPYTMAMDFSSRLFSLDKKYLEYLKNIRQLDENILKKFKIGSNGKAVAIPIYEDNKLINIRYRQDPDLDERGNNRYTSEKGCKSGLFNGDILKDENVREVFVCLTENQEVLTQTGYKEIKDIQLHEKVYTHKGRFQEVYKLLEREYKGSLYNIKPKYFPYGLEMTEEHPVLVCNINKCSCESWELRCHPECKRLNKYHTLNCQKEYKPIWKPAKEIKNEDYLVYPINRKVSYPKVSYGIDSLMKTKDFWYFVGLFIGDGSLHKSRYNKPIAVTICGHMESKLFIEKFVVQFIKSLGRKPTRYLSKETHCWRRILGKATVARFLDQFYNEKREKIIPSWVENLPLELQKELIKGIYHADGCVHKNKNGDDIRISNTSLDLLCSIQRILLRFDIVVGIEMGRKCGISIFRNKRYKSKQLYNIRGGNKLADLMGSYIKPRTRSREHYFIKDDYVFYPVDKVSKKQYSGRVYNISVRKDNSYSSRFIITHNCEGELDALQLIQRGFRNTVSGTLGAGYFPKDWVEKFQNVKLIYFVYDTDDEGKNGAFKAAEKLGVDRCKLIKLPHVTGRKKVDITDYFTIDNYTKADFLELKKRAKTISLAGDDSIKHISEFNDELREKLINGEHIGIPTGYNKLDEMMGGFRKGRLIIISGLTNCGKSSFASNICLNLAVRGITSFFFSLEMPPLDIVKKLLMQRSKLGSTDLKKVEDPSQVLTQVDNTLLEFKDGGQDKKGLPIYLYNGSGTVKYEILEECAKMVKEQYNCQVIFVDHLHYFAHNYANLTAETSKVVRQIKQLAMKLDITIVLLAHLNRGGRSKQRKGLYTPSLSDLKDCFTGDTEVFDYKSGKFITLEEAYNSGQRQTLEVLDDNLKKVIVPNLQVYKTGVKDILEIELESGIKIKGSLNSALYNLGKWTKFKDLGIGSSVAVSCSIVRGNKVKYNSNFLTLLGLLISDGHIDNDLKITSNEEAVVSFLDSVVKEFNCSLKVKKYSNLNCNDCCIRKSTSQYKNDLKTILKSLKLWKTRSETKFIPKCLLELSKNEIHFLLKGLYQGDGSFSDKHNLRYSSTSIILLKGIQRLWGILGIKSKISNKGYISKKGKFPVYELIISSLKDVNYFAINIGFMGNKQIKFLSNYTGSTGRGEKLSKEIMHLLLNKMGKMSIAKFGYRLQKNNKGTYKLISKERLKKIAIKHNDTELLNIANSDLRYEKIVSIKKLGKQMTYDYEVPYYHQFFIGAGLLVHNTGTIEQDADQVLFVCRDSESEEQTDREKAYIKGAKNRDGKAGWSIDMSFDENVTTFVEDKNQFGIEKQAKEAEAEKNKTIEDHEDDNEFGFFN